MPLVGTCLANEGYACDRVPIVNMVFCGSAPEIPDKIHLTLFFFELAFPIMQTDPPLHTCPTDALSLHIPAASGGLPLITQADYYFLVVAATRQRQQIKSATQFALKTQNNYQGGAAAFRDLSVDGIDILVVALQEIEMGTASVAVGAVKEVMGKKVAEQGNHNARWWGDEMSACLGQGCPLSGSGTHRHSWERVAMRQMSGLLLCVYSRRAMCSNVANTATGVVACGVGGFGGNKGAVAVSFSLFGQRVLVMNSHFAAHQVRPPRPIAGPIPRGYA